MVPWNNPSTSSAHDTAEDWVVAATIATEVPPVAVHRSPAKETFTSAMIMAAQQAVAEVMFNRVNDPRFPDSAMAVVLQPKQFSAVMRGLSAKALGHHDIWLGAMAGTWFPHHVEECLDMWRKVRMGALAPLVDGAMWYFSPVSMNPAMSSPSWVAGKTAVPVASIGGEYFRFFKG